ncbi:MAG: hypothetical protein ACO1SV_12300 [Fimbriimonas sp.]
MATQNGTYRKALSALDTGGGVLSIANPEGVDLYVERLILEIDTASTGACTVDAGIAANGTTSSDNLVDGLDVNAAAGGFDNIKNGGTNGKAGQKWGASQYLTISRASGAAAGLVGEAHIRYVRLDD